MLREVVGYLELMAAKDTERFVWTSVETIRKHCNDFSDDKRSFSLASVEKALAFARRQGIVSTRRQEFRNGAARWGFAVKMHESSDCIHCTIGEKGTGAGTVDFSKGTGQGTGQGTVDIEKRYGVSTADGYGCLPQKAQANEAVTETDEKFAESEIESLPTASLGSLHNRVKENLLNPQPAAVFVDVGRQPKQETPRPDTYGPADGSQLVGEALPYSLDEMRLSATAKHPGGILHSRFFKATKKKPLSHRDEKLQDFAIHNIVRIVEHVRQRFADRPYYGLKTRAEMLFDIADTWQLHVRECEIKDIWPQWFVVISEMRRLWRAGEGTERQTEEQ